MTTTATRSVYEQPTERSSRRGRGDVHATHHGALPETVDSATAFADLSVLGDLRARVEKATALARIPGSEVYLDPEDVDVHAWNHVGDPLAEALVLQIRARKLMGGDILETVKRLVAEKVPEAREFWDDMTTIPSWMDWDAVKAGAELGRRNPVGMIFGMHGGLPFTYIDPATARVMASTGRMNDEGRDFRRRFWETATGFVGALDVAGMQPGGRRWELWVRIRLMHTMVRLGNLRSGRWDYSLGIPVSQPPTAVCSHIFGNYRVNIIESLGGVVTQEEKESFTLMWRYIARLEGANNQLLGRTHEENLRISQRILDYLYGPDDATLSVTRSMIVGMNRMKAFPLPQAGHEAVVRRVLSPKVLEALTQYDVPGDLGLRDSRGWKLTLDAAAGVMRGINQLTRLPAIKRLAESRGQQFQDWVVDSGLDHVHADYRTAKE